MNLLQLRERVTRQCGRYNLVGRKLVSGEYEPDYAVDAGVDAFINAAITTLAHEVRSLRNQKHFLRRIEDVSGVYIPNLVYVGRVSVDGAEVQQISQQEVWQRQGFTSSAADSTYWYERTAPDEPVTAEDVIPISTLSELALIGVHPDYPLDGDYQLTRDIDADETSTWYGGAGWRPIGPIQPTSFAEIFSGTFDGNGYVIDNLHMNRPGMSNCGLFSWLRGTVCNLRLSNVNITVLSDVGPLVGSIGPNTHIRNCHADGVVNGNSWMGGLVGSSNGSGPGDQPLVEDSSSSCTVNGDEEAQDIGGFIGGIGYNVLVRRCSASGSVVGKNWIGGFTGMCSGVAEDSYATGSVDGTDAVGGFSGSTEGFADEKIKRCYSTGVVTGVSNVGGLVGRVDIASTVEDSYYDSETTGQSDTGKGTPKTTAEMTQQTTFDGWDFSTVWYPSGLTPPVLRNVVDVTSSVPATPYNICIYPDADTGTELRISCWTVDHLTSVLDSNWFTTNYPRAVVDLTCAEVAASELNADRRVLDEAVGRVVRNILVQDIRDEVLSHSGRMV